MSRDANPLGGKGRVEEEIWASKQNAEATLRIAEKLAGECTTKDPSSCTREHGCACKYVQEHPRAGASTAKTGKTAATAKGGCKKGGCGCGR